MDDASLLIFPRANSKIEPNTQNKQQAIFNLRAQAFLTSPFKQLAQHHTCSMGLSKAAWKNGVFRNVLHAGARRRRSSSRCYHVVVAMSGGVDSSVAAALLQQDLQKSKAITSLSAIYMNNWNPHDDDSMECTSERDWQDAVRVAQHLQDLPIRRQPFEAEYWTTVFEPYLNDILQKGLMGNPDIGCNTNVKFGALLEFCLDQYGPDMHLATGHYARLWHRDDDVTPECVTRALEQDVSGLSDWIHSWGVQPDAPKPSLLLAAADRSKDQSYFLSSCSGDAFRHVLFPLGEYFKNKSPRDCSDLLTVRQVADQLQLPTAKKSDSMGICFVGSRKTGFKNFLEDQYLPDDHILAPVDFCDIDTGKVVGTTAPEKVHPILYAATSGQGAKLSGTKHKYFIVGNHDPPVEGGNHHRVWVCAGTHHPALYSDSLRVGTTHWVAGNECPTPLREDGSWRVQCRIRHLQPLIDCTVRICNDDTGDQLEVFFDKPVRGISPGQQVVFYGLDGLVCFGGGPISKRGRTYWEENRQLPLDLHPSGLNDTSSVHKDVILS